MNPAQSVEFQLAMAIATVNEHFQFAFKEQQIVTLGHCSCNVWLGSPEGDIQRLLIPQNRRRRFQRCGRSCQHVDKARRAGGAGPVQGTACRSLTQRRRVGANPPSANVRSFKLANPHAIKPKIHPVRPNH